MTARRLAPIAAALLIASLAGCNPGVADTKSDSKPDPRPRVGQGVCGTRRTCRR
ncbi:hypothetical protein ACFRFL_25285 [Streptomyces sp. NPDC056708]|uniref:hypothetical protein n=1 Tax=unclassified Streptomyces TaxID=2593676 RepID=UPI00368655A4